MERIQPDHLPLVNYLQSPTLDLRDIHSTQGTLERFSEEVSNTDEYFQQFQKNKDSRYRVKSVYGRGFIKADDARFFLDGEYGFLLGAFDSSRVSPQWIAVTSFRSADRLGFVRPLDNFPLNHPVIVELQGPSKDTYLNADKKVMAQELISGIRWENVLVHLVRDWARTQGFPGISLLPPEMNVYGNAEHFTPEQQKAFMLRYTIAAKRNGFRKQPNQLYGLPLVDVAQ